MKIETGFFSETSGPFLTIFCMWAVRYKEMKIYEYDFGHMIHGDPNVNHDY